MAPSNLLVSTEKKSGSEKGASSRRDNCGRIDTMPSMQRGNRVSQIICSSYLLRHGGYGACGVRIRGCDGSLQKTLAAFSGDGGIEMSQRKGVMHGGRLSMPLFGFIWLHQNEMVFRGKVSDAE